MKIPSVQEAERLIEEAAELNPGLWIEHSKTAGFCARTIAEKCNSMNNNLMFKHHPCSLRYPSIRL